MTTTDVQDTFQIGRVVSRTFSVIGRNAVAFLLLSALLTLPSLFFSLYFQDALAPSEENPMAVFENLTITLPMGLLGVVMAYLLQACLVQGTVSDLNGVKPQFGTMLSSGFRVVGPVVVISILAYLGMVVGVLLLIVPGIILAVMWSVVVPVRVVENTGIGETFARSRALTKGSRWQIFLVALLGCIIAYLIVLVMALVLGVSLITPGEDSAMRSIPFLVGNWLVSAVIYSIIGAGIASIYYELRTVKEGIAPQQLAAAFD
ncbi:MAG TPA: hypothetical protein VJ798_07630 [Rhizomicrobium sp.]|nr:hypothetical protein [Rhizomicrobium sp.]